MIIKDWQINEIFIEKLKKSCFPTYWQEAEAIKYCSYYLDMYKKKCMLSHAISCERKLLKYFYSPTLPS